MNGQNYGEHFNTSEFAEQIDKDANTSVENLDPTVEKVPVLAALNEQTPLGTGSGTPMIEEIHSDVPNSDAVVHDSPTSEEIQVDLPESDSIVHEKRAGEVVPYNTSPAPVSEPMVRETPIIPNALVSSTLLDRVESEHLRMRWNEIQGMFVDEPRTAVQQADDLVSEVVEKITQSFANEHSSLESQWKQGNDVSTEELRKALQHYRSFFNRLVVSQ